MWRGLLFSAAFHGAVVTATLVALPDMVRRQDELPPILPVELLQIANETNVSPEVEVEEPKPEEPPQIEAPEEIEPEPEPEPVSEPQTQPESEPEPEPEPLPAEEPEPEAPPPPEPEPEPEPEAPAPEPEPQPEPEPVRPEPKPEPVVKRAEPEPEPKKDSFDQLAALLDKLPDDQSRDPLRNRDTPRASTDTKGGAAQARAGAGLRSGDTLTLEDAFQSRFRECWQIPAGAPNAEELIVALRVRLNFDGSVRDVDVINSGRYRSGDPYFVAAADSAKRAILECAPYEELKQHWPFQRWQQLEFEFDPSFVLQGR